MRRELSVFQRMITSQVILFLEYLQSMENFLVSETQRQLRERERMEMELGSYFTDMEPEDIDTWAQQETPPQVEALVNEIRIIDGLELPLLEEFGNLLRKSFLVDIYGFVESTLVEECHQRRGCEAQAAMDEVRGAVAKKAMRCLEYSVGEDPDWQEIEHYRALRNCIVHANGSLTRVRNPQERNDLEKYVRRETLLSLDRLNSVMIGQGFCEKAVETVERFLLSVASSMDTVLAA